MGNLGQITWKEHSPKLVGNSLVGSIKFSREDIFAILT